jgi:hypothetical protein
MLMTNQKWKFSIKITHKINKRSPQILTKEVQKIETAKK